jgi:hypothetical protein
MQCDQNRRTAFSSISVSQATLMGLAIIVLLIFAWGYVR